MSRSLFIGICATILLFSGIAVFFYLNNIREKGRAATDAIPNDAFFIFQARNIGAVWETFASTSLWNDLRTNEAMEQLGRQVEDIRSVLDASSDVKDFLEEHTSAVSMHASGGRMNLLIASETGKNIDPSVIAYSFAGRMNGKVIKRTFEKIPVCDVMDVSGNLAFTVSYYEQVIICSADPGLIEDALRKLKYRLPNATKGFEQVKLLAQSGAHGNLYVNYQRLSRFFSLFTKREYADLFAYLRLFANWSMFDVRVESDRFRLSGVTYTDDSLFQFLDLFKNQTPKELTLQEVMPANTSFAFQMAFTDYLRFNAELKEYLGVHNKADQYSRFADSIGKRYDIDINERVLPFIDGEAALVMTEPQTSDFAASLAAFIRFKNPAAMGASMKSFVEAMEKKGEADSVSYYHEGVEIERIKLGNFLKLYYGELMENIRSPYYAALGDVYVFANEVNVLKHIISSYKSGTTLAADEKYRSYASTLAQNNNVSVFISPSRNFLLPAQFVTDTFFSILNTYQAHFRKFEFFNIQFAYTSNKAFYTHVQYRYNVMNTGGNQLVWSGKLDTIFDLPPSVVYNTALKQHVVFVQDLNNTLYCFNHSGGLIWRSRLSGKLTGEITALDCKNDGSLYYLIASEKGLNLVDADGVSVAGYPVHYPGRSVLPVTINRSAGDSAAVCFAPLENSRIVAYAINGRPLPGWNPRVMESKATQPVSVFDFGHKQLFYTSDVKGHLMLYNLKGERVKIKTPFSAACYVHVPSADTASLVFKAVQADGSVRKIVIDSNNMIADSALVAEIGVFDRIDRAQDPVTRNNWFVVHTGLRWGLYDNEWKKVKEEALPDSSGSKVYFISDQAGRLSIGSVSRSAARYAWFDLNGKPLEVQAAGVSPFTVTDVFPGKKTCIIGGDAANNIFLYRLK